MYNLVLEKSLFDFNEKMLYVNHLQYLVMLYTFIQFDNVHIMVI